MRKFKPIAAGAFLLVGTVSLSSAGAADSQSQPAVWVGKETSLVSMSFTTRYSCDGLRDKVEAILLDLGARKSDLKVREQGCSAGAGQPTVAARVNINMSVLVPAGKADGNSVPAHWKTVELRGNGSRYLSPGDCELVDQVNKQLLPMFTTQHIEADMHCVPHQPSATGPVLKVEVLSAMASAAPSSK